MPYRLLVAMLIQVVFQYRGVEAELTLQKRRKINRRRFNSRQDLDPVTGGDDHALRNAGHSRQGTRYLGQFLARDRNPLTQRDGRGLVVDA